MIKFVSDFRQVGGFLRFPSPHDITEILLKVALNTIKQKNKTSIIIGFYNDTSTYTQVVVGLCWSFWRANVTYYLASALYDCQESVVGNSFHHCCIVVNTVIDTAGNFET